MTVFARDLINLLRTARHITVLTGAGVSAESGIPTFITPPLCVHCGGFLRPDVVWFGEQLPSAALEAAGRASTPCDVFFSIGTSSLVEPVASLARVALQQGAQVVEINPTETPLTRLATHTLSGPSGEILPE